jgi:Flp pilus assembly protein TadD
LYWIRQGKPEKALSIFTQLTKQEPKQAVWEIQSGDALARMGQPAYAMVHYQNAVKLDPNDPQNWTQLVLFCLQNNLEIRRIGLPAARRLVMITPEDPSAYDLHGRVLMALGDQDNAMQAFWRGLKVNANSPLLLLDLGMIMMDQQKSNEAFYYLSMAQEMGRQQKDDVLVKKAQSLLGQLR